eukprot:4284350-Pyramimonas_sp.AAC.1
MSHSRSSICFAEGFADKTGGPSGNNAQDPQPSPPALGNHSDAMSTLKWASGVPFSFLAGRQAHAREA